MTEPPEKAFLRIRIVFDCGRGMLGPGKADLLELIEETGSIAGAGRRLGMSYKRAWMLVETMNAMFLEPVVTRSRGGASHGGARLTALGLTVLAHYRSACDRAAAAAAADVRALEQLATPGTGDMSTRK